jgi:5S rRNA maturation endonuclease (ribonuclease M5)
MIDILSYIPQKRKQTSSGWISFNAPCCVHTGESADRRSRGGVKQQEDDWSYHCFNCGFTASFMPGRPVSFKARKLLGWLGVDSTDIERLNLESLKRKSLLDLTAERNTIKQTQIDFDEKEVPEGVERIDTNNKLHFHYVDYLKQRGIVFGYPFLVDKKRGPRDRIVVPYTYKNRIVGHTSRYLDSRTPKFINSQQPGYVFGYDLQKSDWTSAIVVEGIFDALSISGLACMHETISKEQAQLLKQLKRRIIVVPDQDRAGLSIINAAVEHKFEVSIPEWPEDVKDVNDAVVRFGVAHTLQQIHQHAERSKIKIEMAKKRLQRKINE